MLKPHLRIEDKSTPKAQSNEMLCSNMDRSIDRIGGGPVFFANEVDHHFRPEIENFEEAVVALHHTHKRFLALTLN